MENTTPTAEEFLKRDKSGVFNEVDITKVMIEFARLHVKEALKQASKKARITERKKVVDNTGGYIRIPTIYKKYILEAYPLENIK